MLRNMLKITQLVSRRTRIHIHILRLLKSCSSPLNPVLSPRGKKKILVNFKEVKRYSNIGKNQFIAKVLNHKDNG